MYRSPVVGEKNDRERKKKKEKYTYNITLAVGFGALIQEVAASETTGEKETWSSSLSAAPGVCF